MAHYSKFKKKTSKMIIPNLKSSTYTSPIKTSWIRNLYRVENKKIKIFTFFRCRMIKAYELLYTSYSKPTGPIVIVLSLFTFT